MEARSKIRRSQLVVFFVGENSHKSPYIGWEIKTAIQCKKPIYTIRLKQPCQRHSALLVRDGFSGEEIPYDTELDLEAFSSRINQHSAGQYDVFNEALDKIDKKILLEQYKSFLQTSEDLVVRRQNVSNFYISIHSILTAAFGALFPLAIPQGYKLLMGGLLSLLGMMLLISWMKILIAYGNLNSSKMKIISSIEKCLPASLYDAEWAALSDKLNAKKYISFTDIEKRIPLIFMILYSCLLIALVIVSIVG